MALFGWYVPSRWGRGTFTLLMMRVEVLAHPRPWMRRLRFRKHEALKEYVKAIPGTAWDPQSRTWTCPVECVDQVLEEAKKYE